MARKSAKKRAEKEKNDSKPVNDQDIKQSKHKENLEEKPSKKRSRTLDLGDSDTDSDVAEELNVNADYAKQFDHNKERAELQRLEEKYGDVDLDQESSSDEDEDDIGDLVTEDIEEGIQTVLKTIRENPKALLDPSVKFFSNPEEAAANNTTKQKPMLLKDYHRQNLLDQENEDKPYAVQQREDREKLISELHGDGSDDEEDNFLTKRTTERKVEAVELPDPEQNSGAFLEAFVNSKGWVPQNIDPKTGKEVVPFYDELVEEDSDDFDDIADQFETAYNFRYEDPNAAELVSYARSQSTLRRQEQNSRKRQRENKRQAERERAERRKQDLKQLKKLKVNEVMKKFEQLKEALGDDEDILAKFSENDLEGEFDGSEWDKKMQEVFNEEFYLKDEYKPAFDDAEFIEAGDQENQNGSQQEQEKTVSKKQQKAQAKAVEKSEREKLRTTAEKFVEENIDLAIPDNIRDFDEAPKFKYRSVDPESFGLSARDILLADDKDLNEYVGIKKLASFREKEQISKDRKKYAKKKRLREWRKAVFDTEEEPDDQKVLEALTGPLQPKKKKQKKH